MMSWLYNGPWMESVIPEDLINVLSSLAALPFLVSLAVRDSREILPALFWGPIILAYCLVTCFLWLFYLLFLAVLWLVIMPTASALTWLHWRVTD